MVGAAACRECHSARFNSWSESLHSRVVRPISEAGESLPSGEEAAQSPFPLESAKFVLGSMHKLAFLQQSGEHLTVLPVEFDVKKRTWNPISVHLWDPQAVVGALPDASASKVVDWNLRCARCHTTGYDAATGTFAELGVACESCHGPGSVHVETKGKERMVNPEVLTGEGGNHVCGQCHSYGRDQATGKPFPTNYRPGDDLTKTFTFAQPTVGTTTPLFWGNGTARQHHAQYNEFLQSKHFGSGLRCFDCHQVHRLRTSLPSPNTNLMARTERYMLKRVAQNICPTCHLPSSPSFRLSGDAATGKLIDTHTHHPDVITKVKSGPRIPSRPNGWSAQETMLCGECHMPSASREEAGYTIRSHTFKPPGPGEAPGAPNACTECHSQQGADWVERQLKSWRAAR